MSRNLHRILQVVCLIVVSFLATAVAAQLFVLPPTGTLAVGIFAFLAILSLWLIGQRHLRDGRAGARRALHQQPQSALRVGGQCRYEVGKALPRRSRRRNSKTEVTVLSCTKPIRALSSHPCPCGSAFLSCGKLYHGVHGRETRQWRSRLFYA